MSRFVSLAARYVELSNAHDLPGCFAMFDARAHYRSAGLGALEGIDAIRPAMRAFFVARPDVRWDVQRYYHRDESKVNLIVLFHIVSIRFLFREEFLLAVFIFSFLFFSLFFILFLYN